MVHNGFTFECHPQNCLARFDLKTKELRGFVIRDLEGLRIHPETLYATTGVELDCPPGNRHAVLDLDSVYKRAYTTAIYNHLQRLIRVLDLHYNDQGWEIVRKHLSQSIPKDHQLYDAWLSPESKMVPSKCDLGTRIAAGQSTSAGAVSKLLRIRASLFMPGFSMSTRRSQILSYIVNSHHIHRCGTDSFIPAVSYVVINVRRACKTRWSGCGCRSVESCSNPVCLYQGI